MRKGSRAFLGTLFFLFIMGPFSPITFEASGQEPFKGFPISESPVQVEADYLEYKEKERLILGKGHVIVRSDGRTLMADEAEVDLEREVVKARGNVVLVEGPNRLEGERLEYNYRSGLGVLYPGKGFVAPAVEFKGIEVRKEGDRVFRLIKGSFTTCQMCQEPPYAWEFRAEEATIYQDEYVFAKGASLWLKGLPALYSPFFAAPIGPRRTGFLVPHLGYGNRTGFFFKQPFFWAISESQDATFSLTYRGKKGFEEELEYRYILSEVTHGEFKALHLREWDTDRDRSSLKFLHQQSFTPRLSFNADLNYLSDKALERDYVENTLVERTRRSLDSRAYLVQTWPSSSLMALVEVNRDLTQVQDDRLQRVPEVRFSSIRQPLGEAPLFYEFSSSAAYLERKWLESGRLDIRPGFSWPLRPTPWANLTPEVAFRETAYSKRDPMGGVTSRELIEFQGRFETRLFRDFNLGDYLGDETPSAIRHLLEPRLLYHLLPPVNQRDLPQFDAVDFVSPQNRITYSLGNKLISRWRGKEGELRSLEFLSLTLSQSYNLDPKEREFSDIYLGSLAPERTDQSVKDIRSLGDGFSTAMERRFSNIVAELSITPFSFFGLKASSGYNPEEKRMDSLNTNIRITYPGRGYLELASSYVRDQAVHAYTGNINVNFGKGLSMDMLTRYDGERGVLLENNLGLKYETCCWGLTIRYIHQGAVEARPAEDHFRIFFELKTGF